MLLPVGLSPLVMTSWKPTGKNGERDRQELIGTDSIVEGGDHGVLLDGGEHYGPATPEPFPMNDHAGIDDVLIAVHKDQRSKEERNEKRWERENP